MQHWNGSVTCIFSASRVRSSMGAYVKLCVCGCVFFILGLCARLSFRMENGLFALFMGISQAAKKHITFPNQFECSNQPLPPCWCFVYEYACLFVGVFLFSIERYTYTYTWTVECSVVFQHSVFFAFILYLFFFFCFSFRFVFSVCFLSIFFSHVPVVLVSHS